MEENYSMEWKIFSMEWKWNGRKLPVPYGIWKNRLPFHTIPCRQHKSNKIAYKVNLLVFFLTKYN